MKRILVVIATIPLIIGYWFYEVETVDGYIFKSAAANALSNRDKAVYIKDIFKGDWNSLCSLARETVYPESSEFISSKVDKKYVHLLPDTFAFNYNYFLILLADKKPIKIIRIKDPKIKSNGHAYYLESRGAVNCYTRNSAKFIFEENKPPYNSYSILVEGENK